MVGQARIVEDADAAWTLGVSVWERYIGPYTDDQKAMVEAMMNNRLVVTIDIAKVVSWDHRKIAAAASGQESG